MANIIGTNGNDTLFGSGNDTLTGAGGNDIYDSPYYDTDTITDFGGVGKGTHPTAAVIAEVDTLKFQSYSPYIAYTAKNLLLTQNGSNLEITFEVFPTSSSPKVILQNFALENLDNLSKSTGATVDLGNILFYGQTTVTDSFDVFNANSTQSTIFNKNTVTFLNDLNNNVNGFDNSDDVINGQGGDDIINGKSGNDLLRGGAGNDTLIGGAGNDTLIGDTGNNSLVGGVGNDFLNVYLYNVNSSKDDSTLNGGAGDDTLSASGSKGNNLLSGNDGNDILYASNIGIDGGGYSYFNSSGDNTLNGGAGNDTLNAEGSEGNNSLSGGNGNDFLTTSGSYEYRAYSFRTSGNNTLNGGAGDDKIYADFSSGNNLLSGGDGNDTLSTSSYDGLYGSYLTSSGNNTLNGGAGDDKIYAYISTDNNLLSGGDGNDSFYLTTTSLGTDPSDLVTQTVDGGKGDDLLSFNYIKGDDVLSFPDPTVDITSTFNATTNTGSITAGTSRVSYKNIEQFNISGTFYNDNIVGNNGNDTLSTGSGGNDTIDGGRGEDVLSVAYSNVTEGITSTFNATTNIGSITAGTSRVSYKNIEQFNISGTFYNDNIVGN
ncbi:MAG: calcium-binding protein, partial [Nostoc sp.]